MSNRREFLVRAAAASSVLAVGTAGAKDSSGTAAKPLRVLILGGTGFIGPHHVRAAVARGHKIAVFNRGKAKADLPAGVERLIGDRNGDLKAIRGRDWDAVIDTATYGPGWVRSLGEALTGRIGHYTFISTISVYDNPAANEVTRETSKVVEYKGRGDPHAVTSHLGDDYGGLKVLCEREAEAQFPGKALVLRPSSIVGPGDPKGSVPFHAVRVRKGGEMIAAGEPSTPVQFVDVRDMAEFAVRLIEKNGTGVYNAVGPTRPATYGDLIDAARSTVSSPPKVTWIPIPWLAARKDSEMWWQVRFWHMLGAGGLTRMSTERSVAAGFTSRPMSETLSDIARWYEQLPADQRTEFVVGNKRKEDGSAWVPVRATWEAYLARERETLEAWRAEQSK